MLTEAEIGVLWPQAKECSSHRILEEPEAGPAHAVMLVQQVEENQPSELLANFCCFQPLFEPIHHSRNRALT